MGKNQMYKCADKGQPYDRCSDDIRNPPSPLKITCFLPSEKHHNHENIFSYETRVKKT